MDMQLINRIIDLIGQEAALKIACGISRPGPIDVNLDKDKIERAKFFEVIKPNKLELTDFGKMFVVKTVFDYADNMVNSDDLDDEDEDIDEEEDWDDIEEEDWEDEEDEDEDFDEWEEWEEDDEDEEDEEDNYRSKGRRRK